MPVYQIPVQPGTAQRLRVALPETYYLLSLAYVDEDEGGWCLDIADDDGNPLIAGLPLLPGSDLMEPHADLGIPVRLVVYTPGAPDLRPTFPGLGVESLLLFEPIV